MRIWDVDPALLCRSHLLGEHRELHGRAREVVMRARSSGEGAPVGHEAPIHVGDIELGGGQHRFIRHLAMPVRSIDCELIGDGSPGPVTTRLKDLYWKLHDDPTYATPVRYELAKPA